MARERKPPAEVGSIGTCKFCGRGPLIWAQTLKRREWQLYELGPDGGPDRLRVHLDDMQEVRETLFGVFVKEREET